MKKISLSILLIFVIILLANLSILEYVESLPISLIQNLESILNPLVSFLSFIFLGSDYEIFGKVRNVNIFDLPILVAWLLAGGIFFTLRLKFINIRMFKHAIDIARGRYAEPDAPGRISQLQALFAAIAATAGLGNIAGVAIAISLGGPGAVIWMMIVAFLGMSMKCAEVTLGQKYRRFDKNGRLLAGAFYYLEEGLKEKGLPKLGRFLGIIAAILCVCGSIGAGMMFQSNQSVTIIAHSFSMGLEGKFIITTIITALVGVIIIGGITRIASFTDKIVPFMAIAYILSCIIIIISNYDNVGNAVSLMFSAAFKGDAVYGGVIGAIIQGVRRAAFSNEAGFGSAPIAHAAGKTTEPTREGIISILEPFIDTILICFMTGIAIVVTGVYKTDLHNGVLITKDAFATVAPWFPHVLSVMVFLFAFSTMLTYSYYGQQGWLYLNKGKRNKKCFIVFLICIFVGGITKFSIIIDLADILFLSMAIPNLIGMYIMSDMIRKEIFTYIKRLKNGEFESLRKKNMEKKSSTR